MKVFKVFQLSKLYFESPSVHFKKACFHFRYFADVKTSDLDFPGRFFVFIERINDGLRLPVWSRDVYYGAKWEDIYVEIVLPFSEYKVKFVSGKQIFLSNLSYISRIVVGTSMLLQMLQFDWLLYSLSIPR